MRAAILTNAVEFFLRIGRSGGAIERRDDVLDWTIGGSPVAIQNVVIPKGAVADDDIEESKQLFWSRDLAGSWLVCVDGELCGRLIT